MPSWTHLLVGIGITAGALTLLARSTAKDEKKPTPPADLRVLEVEVDGRLYRVVRRGGGTYEVFSGTDPSTFIMLGQAGELATGGRLEDVELMRDDMHRFPSTLFA